MRRVITQRQFLTYPIRTHVTNRPEPLDSDTICKIKNELRTEDLKNKLDDFQNSYKYYYETRSETFTAILKEGIKVCFFACCIVVIIASPEVYSDWKAKRRWQKQLEKAKIDKELENITKNKN